MAYTTINKSSLHMNTKLFTGTGSENAITGIGFQPDWVWFKSRTNTEHHKLYDAVRGVQKTLYSNLDNASYTDAQSLKSFGSDGYTVGTESAINGNGQSIVSWNWKANGQGSANTDGTINSTYTSANTTSGFSIIQYTGTGSAGTVGHGLDQTLDAVIVKKTSGDEDWNVWFRAETPKIGILNDGAAFYSPGAAGINGPTITSDVVGLGTSATANGSGATYVAYCFAEKQGYSKFGSYVGNGSTDGTFVYTGFKPAWIMFKDLRSGQSWNMYDNKRSPINFVDERLRANLNGAEVQDTGSSDMDFVSNGFKLRNNWDQLNSSGQTIIYMAFAAAPLVGTNNIPANAR